MKRNIYLIAVFAVSVVALSSCRIQAPVFKGMENMKFEKVGIAGINMGTEAVFYNPNPFWCKISDLAIDVKLDQKTVGTLGQKQTIKFAPGTELRMPIGLALNTENSILDNVTSILGMIKDKQVGLSINGDIKLKVFGFIRRHFPIKYEQNISLSQIKVK